MFDFDLAIVDTLQTDLKHGTVNANCIAYTGDQDILQTVITTYLQFWYQ